MISRAPPASPALIMFTYSRLKHFGLLAMASESVEPGFDFVADVHQRVLKRPGLCLAFQNSQAAQNRQTGVLQNRKLPREGGEHLAT